MSETPISVVVPAHDEEAVIGRLLAALSIGRVPGDEVVVACNGCSDRTAVIAASYAGVRVLDLPATGKPIALNAGDGAATRFPRFYVDADIVVTSAALHAVARALVDGIEAGAPRVVYDTSRSSPLVRAYYRFWTRLPYFAGHPLGAGVYGVTERGRSRFGDFPAIIADDEYVRCLFADRERLQRGDEHFVAYAPTTMAGVVRIQTRARLGVLQVEKLLGTSNRAEPGGDAASTASLLRTPGLWVPFAVYGAARFVIELRAQLRHRRAVYSGWARDQSSRSGP